MNKRKIGYVICLISVLWLNIMYVDYSVFVLLVMFVVIPVISAIFMRIAWLMEDINISAEKEVVTQGHDIRLWIKNNNRLTNVLVKRVDVNANISFLENDMPYKTIDKRKGLVVNINSQHAGILSVDIKKLAIYDFFMIFCAKKRISKQMDIIVMPEIVLADEDKRGVNDYENVGNSEEYVFSYEPDDNTEVIELRQYRPGDAINHIHWNLSTTGEEYIVKQYGSAVNDKNIIVADIIPVENEQDRALLDKIYCALYSVGNVFAENGILTEFAVWNEESGQMEELIFDDIASLNGAMLNIMRVSGCYNGAYNVFERLQMQFGNGYDFEKTLCITANNIEIMNNVYNIHDTKIKDIVNNVYDVMMN